MVGTWPVAIVSFCFEPGELVDGEVVDLEQFFHGVDGAWLLQGIHNDNDRYDGTNQCIQRAVFSIPNFADVVHTCILEVYDKCKKSEGCVVFRYCPSGYFLADTVGRAEEEVLNRMQHIPEDGARQSAQRMFNAKHFHLNHFDSDEVRKIILMASEWVSQTCDRLMSGALRPERELYAHKSCAEWPWCQEQFAKLYNTQELQQTVAQELNPYQRFLALNNYRLIQEWGGTNSGPELSSITKKILGMNQGEFARLVHEVLPPAPPPGLSPPERWTDERDFKMRSVLKTYGCDDDSITELLWLAHHPNSGRANAQEVISKLGKKKGSPHGVRDPSDFVRSCVGNIRHKMNGKI